MALGGCIGGCDPETKHRYLTYFVDGVPPFGSEQGSQDDAQSAQKAGETEPGDTERKIWFVHETRKDLTKPCGVNCHKPRGAQFDASSARLLKAVPELCFDCHEEFRVSELYVHGPKIAGECLFCHHHHKSKIEHLLKKEQPELCYQCHEVLESGPIPEHPDDPKLQCTECHNPHGGSEPYFMKKK
jgi:predicted CXXCH cytochrome family protein